MDMGAKLIHPPPPPPTPTDMEGGPVFRQTHRLVALGSQCQLLWAEVVIEVASVWGV